MASVKMELSDAECYQISQALDVRAAQIKRSFNAASDDALREVYRNQALALAEVQRKFPVKK